MKTLYLLLGILGCLYQKTHACSCVADERTLVEAFNGVDVLFVGTIENIRKGEGNEIITTFKITIPLKNTSQNELIEITTSNNSGSCGVPVDYNETSIIWGYKFNNVYNTNSCTRSKGIDKDQNPPILKDLLKLSHSTGQKAWFFKNKGLGAKGALKKGFPDGQWEYYYIDGSLKSKGSYNEGIKTGIWKYYRDTTFWNMIKKGRQLEWEYAQENCLEIKIFNEAELNAHFKKEDTLYLIASYTDGKLEGEACEYEFGQLLRKTTYKNGRKHGHETYWDLWYLDGRVSSDKLYTYGVLIQTLK